jgi:hypothetical protein
MYRFSTNGVQDTILGDVASYNFAVSYLAGSNDTFLRKVLPEKVGKNKLKWHLICEANGLWVEKREVAGKREENDGGTLIYLSPGIRAIFNSNWITNLSVGLPTIHDLHGRKRPPNVRLIFGITRVF